ncbi:MAG: zinc-dependent peptidase [Flavobacteriales bacterium]|nr:zinc-dependent peptidase [Flavobacteriales bacterium]
MFAVILLFIILLPFGMVYGAYLYYGKTGIAAFFQNKIIYHTPISRLEYEYLDHFLSKRNTFYNGLSLKGRAKFLNRLVRFNQEVTYKGMEGLQVNREMRVLIASSAVQLTFGLKYYLIENLKGFRVYPSVFYHSMIRHHLRGGMPPEGYMMLSWEHVQKGFFYPNDKYNLALHEMAHALKLSIKHAYNFDYHFYSYLSNWERLSAFEFRKMKHSNDNFLRDYAATNMEEFFAVSVEHFFEVPDQFKEALPQLYTQLCNMLNMDPLNVYGDYKLVR